MYNGLSAGNQRADGKTKSLVGSSETTRGNYISILYNKI